MNTSDSADGAADAPPGVDLDWIMAEFDRPFEYVLAKTAPQARDHRAEVIPRLIRSLEDATSSTAAGSAPEDMAHFYAMFLLAEFRAVEALPALIGAVTLPGEAPFDLFGDAITESLSTVLASLAGGQVELIVGAMRDAAVNRYVRAAAANALVRLVGVGELTREAAIEYLRLALREAIDREDAVCTWLVSAAMSLAAGELRDVVATAFEQGLIVWEIGDLDKFDENVRQGEACIRREMKSMTPLLMENALQELATYLHHPKPIASAPHFAPAYTERWDEVDEVSAPAPHVGRNAPCPCGSGKKFKKCCGGRG